MELSERERRLLQEMETHLLAEDPGLASSLRVHRLRGGIGVALAASGLVIGVVLMGVGTVQGHAAGIGVALIGYLVLLAAVTVTVDYVRARQGRAAGRSEPTSNPPPGP
jgi:hypothetical protein